MRVLFDNSSGRIFLVCPRCSRRVTRVYVPTSNADPRCRRCWGLSYESQKRNYRTRGLLGSLLGSWAEGETVLTRERHRIAAEKRYAERRAIMANQRGGSQ
jgi:hypothetical protein